jgi:hypothetical protein
VKTLDEGGGDVVNGGRPQKAASGLLGGEEQKSVLHAVGIADRVGKIGRGVLLEPVGHELLDVDG